MNGNGTPFPPGTIRGTARGTQASRGVWIGRPSAGGGDGSEPPPNLIDDFEDEDTTVLSPEWSGWERPSDGGTFTTTTDPALSGDVSGELSGGYQRITATRDQPITPSSFSLQVNVANPGTSDIFAVGIGNSSGDNLFYRIFTFDGDIQEPGVFGNTTVASWSPSDTPSSIKVLLDWSASTFSYQVDGQTKESGVDFMASLDAAERFAVRNDSGTIQIDEVMHAPLDET